MRRSTRIRALCLLLAAAAAALPASAARDTGLEEVPRITPTWNRQFEAPLRWHRVTPLGQLLVATTASLYGLDAADGGTLWAHGGLGDVAQGRYDEIPGTALVLLAAEGKNGRAVILDSIDGRIVFDSSRWGIATVLAAHVLPRAGGLLVIGPQVGEPRIRMLLFDLETGDRRWVNDALLGGMGKLASALATLVQANTGQSGITGTPREIGDGAFLIATSLGVYAIDTAGGDTLWEVPGGDDVRFYLTPHRPDAVFVGAQVNEQLNTTTYVSTRYTAYRVSDGTPVWPEPVEMRSEVNDPVFLETGLVLSPGGTGSGKMNFVDYATGKAAWGKKGKGLKAPGSIVDHQLTDAGLVISTGKDSAWTNRGTVYSLNVLDTETGALRFAKPLKVKGRMLGTEVLDRGVLYETTHEISIFDPSTGKTVAESIRSDVPLVTATWGDALYAYSQSDGALWRVDRATSLVTRLSQGKVKLGDKDLPWALEVTDEAVTLLSSQNVVAFGHDGSILFHAHYPAPRQPAFVRVLAYAHAVRAGMAAAAAAGAGASVAAVSRHTEDGSLEKEISSEVAEGYGKMAEGYAGATREFAKIAKARFKASADSTDSVFMLVDLKKGYGLARIDKASGEVRELIDLRKDREPAYQVDAIDNRVYYRPEPTELIGYDMPGAASGSHSGEADERSGTADAPAAPADAASGLR